MKTSHLAVIVLAWAASTGCRPVIAPPTDAASSVTEPPDGRTPSPEAARASASTVTDDLERARPKGRAARDAADRAIALATGARALAVVVTRRVEAFDRAAHEDDDRVRVVEEEQVGELDPGDVERVFRRVGVAFRRCYERELKKDPGVEGRVELTLVVDPHGEVESASADGLNASMRACIEGVAMRMRFEPPTGGEATLRQALLFKNQGATR